jgi:Fe-S cluster assembly protein SufD
VRLVLVNGFFAADLSDMANLPAGVTVASLHKTLTISDDVSLAALNAHGLGFEDPAVALNMALVQDGLVIDVAADAVLTQPLEIIHVSTGTSSISIFTRSRVKVGAGACLTLLETHVGDAIQRQSHEALVFEMDAGAKVDHVVTPAPSPTSSVHVSTLLTTMAEHARFQSFATVLDASFVRRQSFLRFNGAHSYATLSGVSVLGGQDHADTTLVVEHLAPDCQSRETFKHIVDGVATGVFQGRIKVAQLAQKTDGKMSSRAILVGENAAMYNKPELEIFADDVVCGHGATCGELDEEQVFYAMSRGLPRAVAEAMLLEAFVGEVIDGIAAHVGLRTHAVAAVSCG